MTRSSGTVATTPSSTPSRSRSPQQSSSSIPFSNTDYNYSRCSESSGKGWLIYPSFPNYLSFSKDLFLIIATGWRSDAATTRWPGYSRNWMHWWGRCSARSAMAVSFGELSPEEYKPRLCMHISFLKCLSLHSYPVTTPVSCMPTPKKNSWQKSSN